MKKPITDTAAAPPAPPKVQPKPKEEPVQEPLPIEPEPEPERDVEEEIKSIWKQFPRGAGRIREAAVAQERDRLSALDQFDNIVCASIVAEAKVSGKTADEIALACYKAMAGARDREARHSDAKVLDAVSAGDAPFQPIRPAAAPPNNGKDRSHAVNLLVNAAKGQARKPQKN